MHGVVSLLDQEHDQKVEELWRELDLDCGMSGVLVTPVAHFSWHVAQDYDLDVLRPAVQEIASMSVPFYVRTSGIGLFTGERPVVFISLVKDDILLSFHEMVWQKINQAALKPSPFYTPQAWMPHITLAHADTDWQRLTCAMEKLVFQPFNWEIPVDNLALISQAEGQVGEKAFSFKFSQPIL